MSGPTAKFRAWDKFQNKYVFVGFHVFGEVTCFSLMDRVISDTWKERSEQLGYQSTIEAWNDFIEEQWTTFKDATGVDIYDGDVILVTPHDKREEPFMRVVKQNRNGSWAMFKPGLENFVGEQLFPYLKMTQVIGHIHRKDLAIVENNVFYEED